jgi:uncharacterized protein YecE (DUF72 family)
MTASSQIGSRIVIGTSGWTYPHWRAPVYQGAPQSRWLERYAAEFPTVELNATFYRLPRPVTVERWAQRAPEHFLFAVKVSRYLTHVRRLRDIGEGVDRLRTLLAPLAAADRLGPWLWQLPPGFARDDARLREALAVLPPGRHAFEFRDPSWFCPPVLRLLERAGACLVIGDTPTRPFQTLDATTDWRYLRFHHGTHGRRGNYASRELATWAGRIDRWARDGDVYAYFNNDWEAFAIRNARELQRRVAGGARTVAA